MPFVNASGNQELEYLSDGVTESLINSLSQLSKLSVKRAALFSDIRAKISSRSRSQLTLKYRPY
jgi:TolB-like protein